MTTPDIPTLTVRQAELLKLADQYRIIRLARRAALDSVFGSGTYEHSPEVAEILRGLGLDEREDVRHPRWVLSGTQDTLLRDILAVVAATDELTPPEDTSTATRSE